MKVVFTKKAQKDLLRTPLHCQTKALDWIEQVEEKGIREVRMIPGYHDEPLQGEKKGRRSIRLSKKYRLEYQETQKEIQITVIEIHAHKY